MRQRTRTAPRSPQYNALLATVNAERAEDNVLTRSFEDLVRATIAFLQAHTPGGVLTPDDVRWCTNVAWTAFAATELPEGDPRRSLRVSAVVVNTTPGRDDLSIGALWHNDDENDYFCGSLHRYDRRRHNAQRFLHPELYE
jgi:hypothetical protein